MILTKKYERALFSKSRDKDASPQLVDQASASYCLEPCEEIDKLRMGHPWLPDVKIKKENWLYNFYFAMN